MFRSSVDDFTPSDSEYSTYLHKVYQRICTAANNKDKAASEELMALKLSFIPLKETTVFYAIYSLGKPNYLSVIMNGMTPIQFLAYKQHQHAVNFLLKAGAQASEAIRGYAMNGLKMDYLMNPKNEISLEEKIAREMSYCIGLAQGGQHDRVNELLINKDQCFTLKNEQSVLAINLFLMGYALGGYHEKITELLTRNADINFAILGYAVMNNKAALQNLIQENVLELDQCLPHILLGYAIAGDINEIEKMLSQHNLSENQLINESMSIGFAMSGCLYDYAYKMLLSFVNPKLRSTIAKIIDGNIRYHNSHYFMPLTLAENLNQAIKDYSFTYQQAQAHLQPRNKSLLTQQEREDYENKLAFHENKLSFIKDLNGYTQSYRWKHHAERANSLAVACEKLQSKQGFQNLITYQLGLFNGHSGKPNSKKAHKKPLVHNADGEYKNILLKYNK